MRIGLIQVDGKMPNLALMKLSAYHKARGDQVFFNDLPSEPFDRIYLSCIFSKNAARARGIAKLFPGIEVVIGGYGMNGSKLPEEVEHTCPDYDLYGCDYSMGFTSRGCIRACPFCHVPKMEGMMRDHAPIQEFHRPDHRKIMLLDNNILASPRWLFNWNYVLDQGLEVCVTQGFDARLVTEANAGLIAQAKCFDTKFKHRAVYTAWDNPADGPSILRGIQRLLDAGIRGPELIVYLLVGYDTTLDQDRVRFARLLELDVRPFVMPYNGRRGHPMVRWGQRPAIYMKIPFEDYQVLRANGVGHPEQHISQIMDSKKEVE